MQPCILNKLTNGSYQCSKCKTTYTRSDFDGKSVPHCGYGLVKMAVNLAKSSAKHLANGAELVSVNVHKERLLICQGCEFFNNENPKKPRCGKCGCFLHKKTSWASESCPIDKWGAIAKKNKPCNCSKKKSKNTS
jgi:hypothetical protein